MNKLNPATTTTTTPTATAATTTTVTNKENMIKLIFNNSQEFFAGQKSRHFLAVHLNFFLQRFEIDGDTKESGISELCNEIFFQETDHYLPIEKYFTFILAQQSQPVTVSYL